MKNKPVFSDAAVNNFYYENGYAIIKLFNKQELAALLEIYEKYDNNSSQVFYCSNWISDKQIRNKESNEIQNLLSSKVAAFMAEYKILYACFITKRFGTQGKIHPHIDWQFVEEPEHVAFNIWMPLKATRKVKGSIWVIPGSHTEFNDKRGPNIDIQISADWLAKSKDIHLQEGEALIYDTRLIHGSYPNLMPWKRIAMAGIVVPKSAKLLHHFKDVKENKITTYEVDESFYREDCNFSKTNPVWELSESLKQKQNEIY